MATKGTDFEGVVTRAEIGEEVLRIVAASGLMVPRRKPGRKVAAAPKAKPAEKPAPKPAAPKRNRPKPAKPVPPKRVVADEPDEDEDE